MAWPFICPWLHLQRNSVNIQAIQIYSQVKALFTTSSRNQGKSLFSKKTLPSFQIHCLWSACTLMWYKAVFFRWDISVIYLLRHFGHWDISVICLAVVSKLTVTMFIILYFQTFWLKWLDFFQSFQKHFGLWPKKPWCEVVLSNRDAALALIAVRSW